MRLHGRRHHHGHHRRLRLRVIAIVLRTSSRVRLAAGLPALAEGSRRWLGAVGRRGGSVLALTHPIAHATRTYMHTRTYTHSLSPSLLLAASLHPTKEKGRYYIGGILVLARLGPRQFWEWSSKNSRGKSCPLLLLLLLLPLEYSCPLAASSSSSSSARRGIAVFVLHLRVLVFNITCLSPTTFFLRYCFVVFLLFLLLIIIIIIVLYYFPQMRVAWLFRCFLMCANSR